MLEHLGHQELALVVRQRELLRVVGEDADAVRARVVRKSMQRRWPSKSRSPLSWKIVGATGNTPR
jgi:hypothetical protein